MKPRDILLRRHQAAMPRLDAIRESILTPQINTTLRPDDESNNGRREHLRPLHWHLVGLSAAWAVVMLLNIGLDTGPQTDMAAGNRSSPTDLVMAVRDNRQQLLYLLDARPLEATPFVPR